MNKKLIEKILIDKEYRNKEKLEKYVLASANEEAFPWITA